MGAVGQLFALIDRFETSEMVATSCEIVAEVAQNDEENQALLATEANIVKLMALAESYAEEKVFMSGWLGEVETITCRYTIQKVSEWAFRQSGNSQLESPHEPCFILYLYIYIIIICILYENNLF